MTLRKKAGSATELLLLGVSPQFRAMWGIEANLLLEVENADNCRFQFLSCSTLELDTCTSVTGRRSGLSCSSTGRNNIKNNGPESCECQFATRTRHLKK